MKGIHQGQGASFLSHFYYGSCMSPVNIELVRVTLLQLVFARILIHTFSVSHITLFHESISHAIGYPSNPWALVMPLVSPSCLLIFFIICYTLHYCVMPLYVQGKSQSNIDHMNVSLYFCVGHPYVSLQHFFIFYHQRPYLRVSFMLMMGDTLRTSFDESLTIEFGTLLGMLIYK